MYRKEEYEYFYLDVIDGNIWVSRHESDKIDFFFINHFLPLTENSVTMLNMIIPDQKDNIEKISEKLQLWEEVEEMRFVDSGYWILNCGSII